MMEPEATKFRSTGLIFERHDARSREGSPSAADGTAIAWNSSKMSDEETIE